MFTQDGAKETASRTGRRRSFFVSKEETTGKAEWTLLPRGNPEVKSAARDAAPLNAHAASIASA